VPQNVTCCAVLGVRNEAAHLRRALSAYTNQGIDVVIIDNASTDDTLAICREFLGRGLLRVEYLPWHGVFDLSAQLEAKDRIFKSLPHDWIIHADADEWLQSPRPGEGLVDGITRLAEQGFNAINFDQFVFLPEHQDTPEEYEKVFLRYYYYHRPESAKRLMRAWKRIEDFDHRESGGHKLKGANLRVAPENFVLRHYIVLSYSDAVSKYVGRKFSTNDIQKGWHRGRLNISAERLLLPDISRLKKLPRWDSKDFDRSTPYRTHYWRW
jgi:glycosyltransferase involved in cell wall biosynthesis